MLKNFIKSTIVIRLTSLDAVADLQIKRSFPYAIDKEKKVLILLNRHNGFEKIREEVRNNPAVKSMDVYTEPLPEYESLYRFCNRQIIENTKGRGNPEQEIEFANEAIGMARYYCRLRCYRNLFGIDISQLTPEE